MSWDYVNSLLTSEDYRMRGKVGQAHFRDRLKRDSELKKLMSKRAKENIAKAHETGAHINRSFQDKKHTEKTKQKMSAAHKGKHLGKQNSSFGSKWAVNRITGEAKKIYNPEDLSSLSDEWIVGRRSL